MVKFAEKLVFGTSKTDLREDINFTRMREERAERMRQVLRREKLAAVLVTHEPNVRYLTGFSWAEFMTYLFTPCFLPNTTPSFLPTRAVIIRCRIRCRGSNIGELVEAGCKKLPGRKPREPR